MNKSKSFDTKKQSALMFPLNCMGMGGVTVESAESNETA